MESERRYGHFTQPTGSGTRPSPRLFTLQQKLIDKPASSQEDGAFALFTNPSALLRTMVEVFYVPTTRGALGPGGVAPDVNSTRVNYGSAWNLVACTRSPENELIGLHTLEQGVGDTVTSYAPDPTTDALDRATAGLLPRAYEIDSAAREIYVEMILSTPYEQGLAAYIAGAWWVRVWWQPNQPGIPQAELEKLFGLCQLSSKSPI